jgi:hypothetical protein
MLCYSNNGLSYRHVDDEYVVLESERLFNHPPSEYVMLCYSNNGLSYRHVDDEYVVLESERLFNHPPSENELSESFPLYAIEKQKADIIMQIESIEASITTRMRDDAIMDIINNTDVPNIFREKREDIAALRLQLQNLC